MDTYNKYTQREKRKYGLLETKRKCIKKKNSKNKGVLLENKIIIANI